jgi:hypothetical protein
VVPSICCARSSLLSEDDMSPPAIAPMRRNRRACQRIR